MKKLNKLRLEVLEETAKHYNSTNRSQDPESGRCSYFPPDDVESDGCAIGRLIEDKSLCVDFEDDSLQDIFYKLPEWLQELGMEFLDDLQGLHDVKEHWDEKGLTERGKERYESIKKKVTDEAY